MHDNMTVAWEIRYPWRARRYRDRTDQFLRTYHDPFITIWHRDPETDGSDDSCDWSYRRLSERELAYMMQILDNPDDNIRAYFGELSDHMQRFIVRCVARYARRLYRPRPWWRHPKWHIWHWRVQVHPIQQLQRWLWTRCAFCGGRFYWGHSVVAGAQNNGGPRWFRGERDVYHIACYKVHHPWIADDDDATTQEEAHA